MRAHTTSKKVALRDFTLNSTDTIRLFAHDFYEVIFFTCFVSLFVIFILSNKISYKSSGVKMSISRERICSSYKSLACLLSFQALSKSLKCSFKLYKIWK